MSFHPPPQLSQHPSGLSQDQIEDLEAKFFGWQTIVNLSCVATAVLFLFGSHFLLTDVSRLLAISDGLSGLHIHYQQAIWWFFPAIGAFSLSFEIVLQAWSVFASRRIVGLYADWAARQPKRARSGSTIYYDSRKRCRHMALLLALPVGVGTGLALNMHTTFANDGMHEYGYAFAAPKIHPYDQIRRVIQVDGVQGKHGFISKPYDVLDFADGYRWSQHAWDDSSPGITEALDDTIQAHTNLSFLHAHVL
jgi:hypothetical protein